MLFKEEKFPLTREGWERAKQSTTVNKIKNGFNRNISSGIQMDMMLTTLLGLTMFYHDSMSANEILEANIGLYKVFVSAQFLGFGICITECLAGILDYATQNNPRGWVEYYLK